MCSKGAQGAKSLALPAGSLDLWHFCTGCSEWMGSACAQKNRYQWNYSSPALYASSLPLASSSVPVLLPRGAQWIVIDNKGESLLLHSGKMAITQQMGVQLRDLRLLDPKLATSYPSAILCRERALVLNLEYVKCIVTIGELGRPGGGGEWGSSGGAACDGWAGGQAVFQPEFSLVLTSMPPLVSYLNYNVGST